VGHILVDLDGTLAEYDNWVSPTHIGNPVPEMAFRVKKWLSEGKDVRIFTARASVPEMIPVVEEWAEKHFGQKLKVTNQKDFSTETIWDDRARQVEINTGRLIGEKRF